MSVGTSSPTEYTCRAPFTSMYLDPGGLVSACCQNRLHPLGRVQEAALEDIWRGPAAEELRRRVGAGDLSLGCELCAVELDLGTSGVPYLHHFDELEPVPEAAWPVQLELALSIACNLQCVMCNGELSSAIRIHREGRPAIESPYGEAFFEQLDPFLPHLQRLKLLGGEPFLGTEPLRVLDRLVALDLRPAVLVTTNGTQWNERVERVLRSLPVHASISIDAWTPDTLAAIRVGVDPSVLRRNIEAYREACSERPGGLSLTFTLMRLNWQELGEVLAFADDLDVDVGVSTLTNPPQLALATLPADDLEAVIDGLRAQDRHWGRRLRRNLPVWTRERERLEQLGALRRRSPSPVAAEREAEELAAAWADRRGVHRVRADGSQLVVSVDPDGADVFGVDLRALVGGPTSEVVPILGRAFGELASTDLAYRASGVEERTMRFNRPGGSTDLKAFLAPAPDDGHVWLLAAQDRIRVRPAAGDVRSGPTRLRAGVVEAGE